MLSKVNNDTKDEWNKIYTDLQTGQLSRNRAIVKEIIETCLHFTDEIDQEVADMKGDPDDDQF